jgi:CheY-like chemotaxis protein
LSKEFSAGIFKNRKGEGPIDEQKLPLQDFRPFEVLIADDSPGDFVLLRESFLEAGIPCHLHYVKNGSEAIRFLERHNPETNALALAILDARMPQSSGFEVLNYMKSQPNLSEIRVVLISGLFIPGECETATCAGAMCLEKPMTLESWKDLAAKAYTFASSGRELSAAA